MTASIRNIIPFYLRLLFLLSLHASSIKASSNDKTDSSDSLSRSCSHPLGLTNRVIEDWQLAASSRRASSEDKHCAVKYARLHQRGSRAWCAAKAEKGEWLLVDLGVASEVSGVITQGRGETDEWVTKFMLSYSVDAYNWEYARDIYGNKKVFKGNSDAHRLRNSYLEHPVQARFVRIHPVAWHGHPSLRLEIVGCQECNEIISILPFTELSASSSKRWKRRKSCSPDMGDIYSSKGWCPRKQNEHQWLQFDLGPPTRITGVITRGQGDKKRFVTSYSLSYSNDSSIWLFYKDANHLEAKIFGGNMDTSTERRHYLNQPIVSRYVRIHPLTWNKRIGLRAGILGCPHRGECGPGFMQVNTGSACIPNRAFRQPTWVNDKRHTWKEWRYGHSALAVDGKLDASLPNCAIMDNYYVDKPVWTVDLGKEQDINGIVVRTWQGAGQDKITAYTDYVHNLDKLTVFVSHKASFGGGGGGGHVRNDDDEQPAARRKRHRRNKSSGHSGPGSGKCATVSRLNNALFNPRLHLECPEPRRGRYVHVKATGVSDRWRKLFTVVLCEVMVY